MIKYLRESLFRFPEPLLCTPLSNTVPWKFQLSQQPKLCSLCLQQTDRCLHGSLPPCATILRVSSRKTGQLWGTLHVFPFSLGSNPVLPVSIFWGEKNCFIYFGQFYSCLWWKVHSHLYYVVTEHGRLEQSYTGLPTSRLTVPSSPFTLLQPQWLLYTDFSKILLRKCSSIHKSRKD